MNWFLHMAHGDFDSRKCWHSKHLLVDWRLVLGCHPFAYCVRPLSSKGPKWYDYVWFDIIVTCFEPQPYTWIASIRTLLLLLLLLLVLLLLFSNFNQHLGAHKIGKCFSNHSLPANMCKYASCRHRSHLIIPMPPLLWPRGCHVGICWVCMTFFGHVVAIIRVQICFSRERLSAGFFQ